MRSFQKQMSLFEYLKFTHLEKGNARARAQL